MQKMSFLQWRGGGGDPPSLRSENISQTKIVKTKFCMAKQREPPRPSLQMTELYKEET